MSVNSEAARPPHVKRMGVGRLRPVSQEVTAMGEALALAALYVVWDLFKRLRREDREK
jgi:hypothetical protein